MSLLASLVQHKDVFETLSYIATSFALFVPLPAWLFVSYRTAKSERKARTIEFIMRLTSDSLYLIASQNATILAHTEVYRSGRFENLKLEDKIVMTTYFNQMQSVSDALNTGYYDKQLFYRIYGHAYYLSWLNSERYVRWARENAPGMSKFASGFEREAMAIKVYRKL